MAHPCRSGGDAELWWGGACQSGWWCRCRSCHNDCACRSRAFLQQLQHTISASEAAIPTWLALTIFFGGGTVLSLVTIGMGYGARMGIGRAPGSGDVHPGLAVHSIVL